jgi:hypothetical protein
MKLEQYLHQKYGQHSVGLTKAEARQFGIPYPLIHGWEKRHAKLEITPDMAQHVVRIFQNPTASAGKQALRERALLILGNIIEEAETAWTAALVAEQDAHIRDLLTEALPVQQKPESKSGKVPQGDVRLTANIRKDLHMKLKLVAVMRSTTIGALIEEMVEGHL